MPKGFDKLAGAIGDTLKTAPTIYEDALQPTVQEVGKFAARIPRAINAAFSGLDKWILNREYNVDETKKLLEQKLQNVNPKKIVEPEPYIAIPAIQAISYSADNEELRNLYANLLARSMDSDTKNRVHPSFVEIIKQMSPIDAMVFNEIKPARPLLVAKLGVECYKINMDSPENKPEPEIEYGCYYEGVTAIQFADRYSVMISLDNLLRLRLIEEGTSFIEDTSPTIFDENDIFFHGTKHVPNSFKSTPLYHKCKKNLQKDLKKPNSRYIELYHYDDFTTYGRAFYDICINTNY